MWSTLEIHIQRKAASTNTTASILLNVVKDHMLKEDGLHIFQPHTKMSEKKLPDLAKKASVKRQFTVNLTTAFHVLTK